MGGGVYGGGFLVNEGGVFGVLECFSVVYEFVGVGVFGGE